MRAAPEIKRSRGLAVRMVLAAVLTPVIALALIAGVIALVPGHELFYVVMALIAGFGFTGYRMWNQAPDGRQLSKSDDPELFDLVERLCALADLACPDIVLSDEEQANSWVVHLPGQKPRLYLTKGLRELLTLDELQAVVAHELTHVANRDALVMSVVSLPSLAMMNSRGMGWIFVAPPGAVAHTGALALSRYRELAADAGAAALTGRPSVLASALVKVSGAFEKIPTRDLREASALNVFNLVAVPRYPRWWDAIPLPERLTATHPPLQTRLDALQALEAAQHRPGG